MHFQSIGHTELTPSWSEGLSALLTVPWIWISVESDLSPPLELVQTLCAVPGWIVTHFKGFGRVRKSLLLRARYTQIWLWRSYLALLNFHFLVHKIRLIVVISCRCGLNQIILVMCISSVLSPYIIQLMLTLTIIISF